jgi:hypothetical protein
MKMREGIPVVITKILAASVSLYAEGARGGG